jgi:hypothetical protein
MGTLCLQKGVSMNEDVHLFDEFTAIQKLFEKTQVEYIRPGWSKTTATNDYPSRELLEILRSEGDRTKVDYVQ